MSKKVVQFLFFIFVSINLMACGESEESLFTKEVPANEQESFEQGGELGETVDTEEPEDTQRDPGADNNSGETRPSNPTVPLIDKVLANSDAPAEAVIKAFTYYDRHKRKIRNKKYITIIDYSKHSSRRRMYIIYLPTGDVESLHAAHGKNSDRNNDGWTDSFSNVNGSKQSSLGFMLTAERYWGNNGLSMRLDGLEARNSRVRQRAIVIHGANYVSPGRSKMGRSWGCPAVAMNRIRSVVNRIEGGSLYYAHY